MKFKKTIIMFFVISMLISSTSCAYTNDEETITKTLSKKTHWKNLLFLNFLPLKTNLYLSNLIATTLFQ